ncbi:hypothetical protein NDU88_000233 [Pleurodeles waltl]|uniref:Uncharacterized protein n=1 Tax=Pleurodeles waltl TaxID=8319 RepID=A0AAV7P4E6_PLEWA|nr:hypothetical protein NDU88_000233 [Pleurodeles waltl]
MFDACAERASQTPGVLTHAQCERRRPHEAVHGGRRLQELFLLVLMAPVGACRDASLTTPPPCGGVTGSQLSTTHSAKRSLGTCHAPPRGPTLKAGKGEVLEHDLWMHFPH